MARWKVYPYGLIGTKAKVVQSCNVGLVGLEGDIVDETRESISLETKGEVRVLMKRVILLELANGQFLKGNELIRRPEERLKGI